VSETGADGRTRPPACCKLGRVSDESGLDGLDADLVTAWTGDGEATSLRDLADEVNVRLVRAAMTAAADTPLDGEAANVYRLLTDDDVSSGIEVDARNRLDARGVDVDALESRFVSHQTVHTHLTDCLGVSKDATVAPATSTETEHRRVRTLQSRAEAVSHDAIKRLRDRGDLALTDFSTVVDVAVRCRECGRRHEFGALVDAGGCPCQLDGS
jgi:hypothetical protein